MERKRITIITGYYGTGKTEFSVNYAIDLSKNHDKVAIVDLDIINMYFRSREKEQLFDDNGIQLIGSSIKGSSLDVPAISPAIAVPFRDKTYKAVYDLGGDTSGIRVLRGFKEHLVEGDYDLFYVVNLNRPEYDTKEKVLEHMMLLEIELGLKITGLINNTHLLGYTTFEDVKRGHDVSLEIAEEKGIPLVYNSVEAELLKSDERFNELEGENFPIEIRLRSNWMS